MPVPVQDIIDQMRFALDAEGQDYYDDNRDFIPSINASVRWLVNVINQAIGENKVSEEVLVDLSTVDVFYTSKNSRVSLNVFPSEVWTIIGVYPKPVVDDTGNAYTPPVSNINSAHRTDKYFIESEYSCKRLNAEEWNENSDNPFEAGYKKADLNCPDVLDFAYVGPKNYGSNGSGLTREIEIRPYIPEENVAVEYIRKHDKITLVTDDVEFPDTLFQMIFNRALKYIAYKQGDQTNLFAVTSEDIEQLINSVT